MHHVVPQAAVHYAKKESVCQSVFFNADFLACEHLQGHRRRAMRGRNTGSVPCHGQGFVMVLAEDQHLVVGLGENLIDRYVHHHVRRLTPQVMPLPDHVAQIVAHLLAGPEADDFRCQAELSGDGLAEVHIDPLLSIGIRWKAVVDGDAQSSALPDGGQLRVGQRRQLYRQRQGGKRFEKVTTVIGHGGSRSL